MQTVKTTINLPLDVKDDIDFLKNTLGFSTLSETIIESIKKFKEDYQLKQEVKKWEQSVEIASSDKDIIKLSYELSNE